MRRLSRPPSVHTVQSSGRWLVGAGGAGSALSWHRTAGEAEVAARRLAIARDAQRIYLHDLYQRVRRL